MNDGATQPDTYLHEDATDTSKLLMSPDYDSSTAASVNVLDRQKRKCGRKGRRKSGTKKHRAGRNQKRRYKPYHRMSVSERQKVDDRNEKRNSRKREYYHSCGLSLAPPNTNQFLFQDRPETDLLLRKFEGNEQNFDSNSDQSSMSEFNTDSESDEFQIMWKREGRQKLEEMSDQQLRQYFIDLEDKLAEAERKKLEGATKIRIFQDEVRNYESANEIFSKLNAGLAKDLEYVDFKVEKDDKKDLPVANDLSSANAV